MVVSILLLLTLESDIYYYVTFVNFENILTIILVFLSYLTQQHRKAKVKISFHLIFHCLLKYYNGLYEAFIKFFECVLKLRCEKVLHLVFTILERLVRQEKK